MKQSLLIMTILMMLAGISGCETMEGFGKDLQKLGNSIEDSADEDDSSD